MEMEIIFERDEQNVWQRNLNGYRGNGDNYRVNIGNFLGNRDPFGTRCKDRNRRSSYWNKSNSNRNSAEMGQCGVKTRRTFKNYDN